MGSNGAGPGVFLGCLLEGGIVILVIVLLFNLFKSLILEFFAEMTLMKIIGLIVFAIGAVFIVWSEIKKYRDR
ncbi:MAG: hypothetical protein IKU84_01145 [Clostridia bacterium]|nr:hypothetical protein [Clostridia bacterium]